ncbi:conserved hypothetical protein [Hyphomicrobiales bacterium]|jgi:hypothetical protein|nr:conserved hypothetical protein [Hyphomicrobiales bacterium]CAH1702860.1 hypothetical protein BOSEA1005_30732 [Hyphomicrobiales bacterium]CAI0347047.1 conserved hypothetical protein [Hyphomicrobiales bacterium]
MKRDDIAIDEGFRAAAVHGFYPLVRDDAAPAGIRFADPKRDTVEDLLTDPTLLPDAEISLRVFPSTRELHGYEAAAAEFGGNSVAVITGPSGRDGAVALVLRYDRERELGLGVNDSIKLVSPQDKAAQDLGRDLARGWMIHKDLQAKRNADAAFMQGWQSVADLLDQNSVFTQRGDTGSGALAFRYSRGNLTEVWEGSVKRVPEGLLIAAHPRIRTRRDEDLNARLRAEAESRGYVFDENDVASRTVPALDLQEVERLKDAVGTLSLLELGFNREQKSRDDIGVILGDRENAAVLDRIAKGCPVAHSSSDRPMQMSPRSGKLQTVAWSRVTVLFKAGLIKPLYWTLQWEGRPTFVSLKTAIFGLTPSGKLAAAGDRRAAAVDLPRDKAIAQYWNGYSVPDGFEFQFDADSFKGIADPAQLEALGERVDGVLGVTNWKTKPAAPAQLAIVAAGVSCGRVRLEDQEFHLETSPSPRI